MKQPPEFKNELVSALSWRCFPADNWWCFVDDSVFTRLVDMYKSIVVFLLRGGKTLLVPISYESYFVATLRLLEKLHKVCFRQSFCNFHHLFFLSEGPCFCFESPRYIQPFLFSASR